MALIFGSLFLTLSCAMRGCSGPADAISIGFMPGQSATEAYVALDKGFFNGNGLNVTIKNYDSGIVAVEGLLRNEIDIAGASETALVTKALERRTISAIAVANRVESFYLVGRRDRDIENIADLAGKRVGVSLRTITGFYLQRFLELHGISPNSINLIDMKNSQTADALRNGVVDAVAAIRPYADTLKNDIDTNTVNWNIQNSQPTFGMFIGRNDWIMANPGLVERFLKAIEQANDFILRRPEEAKTILKKRFNYTDEYLESVWPENNFALSLDQSLIIAMEDEARWMIENSLTTATEAPNFLDYILADGLKSVKPDAVRFVGR